MAEFELSNASFTTAISRRAAARLRAFRTEVERTLPGQVEHVVLFGSRARHSARSTSDYDVAVLLGNGVTPPPRLGHVLSDLAYPHVRAGIPIRAIVLTTSVVNSQSPIPIAREIARDGIEVV